MTTFERESEHIATLVHPDEYAKHINQVASVYDDKLIFVKRKFASLASFELVHFSMQECTSIIYEIKWAIVSMVFGALLIISIALVLLFGSVPGGTRVPVGALAFVLIFGFVLFRGPRRHRLTFVIGGKKFKWESKAGDFKYKSVSSTKVVLFARGKGLLGE